MWIIITAIVVVCILAGIARSSSSGSNSNYSYSSSDVRCYKCRSHNVDILRNMGSGVYEYKCRDCGHKSTQTAGVHS